jgi:hypothetical protein
LGTILQKFLLASKAPVGEKAQGVLRVTICCINTPKEYTCNHGPETIFTAVSRRETRYTEHKQASQ